MIKKSVFLGIVLVCLASIISCEKDFQETGVNILGNPSFGVKDTVINVVIDQEELERVRTDNNAGNLGGYLLGIYDKPGYKKITASIVSQLGFVSNLKTKGDSIYNFEKAFLVLPYIANRGNEKSPYEITVLGKSTAETTLKVYKNEKQLYSLNPEDPSKQKIYYSNEGSNYTKDRLLNNSSFKFTPSATTIKYTFDIAGKQDSIAIKNDAPFITVPLDNTVIKELFWDKFESPEFSSADAFQKYFKGIHIEANSNLTSLDLTSAFLAIYYTKTKDKETAVRSYSFPLGIKTSIYDLSGSNTTDGDNFTVQGTAGSIAEINLLENNQLQELRKKNWLINEASLTFFVDVDKDTSNIPTRLFLYKKGNPNKKLSDLFAYGRDVFDGILKEREQYNFRITKHIADVLKQQTGDNLSLGLSVYNPTDYPTDPKLIPNPNDTIVRNYNWNPRSVKLLNSNAINGEKRAQLKIYYTEKK